jgi:arginase
MASSFMIVPQWQGSVSSRAMRLADGAEAVRADLPPSATVTVAVPLGAGSDQGSGVHRLTSLQRVRDESLSHLRQLSAPVVTIGGDCGVSLAPVQHVLAEQGDSVAVVWFDSHPDLNTSESSPSGAFGGMVLRTLLGDGAAALVGTQHLQPNRVVLAGTRQPDPAEDEYLEASEIRVVPANEFTPDALVAALRETGATSVYVHVDLDVLDPGEFSCLGAPVPFGLSVDTLIAAIKAVGAALPLAGATIAGFAPDSPEQADDALPAILRVIGALTA